MMLLGKVSLTLIILGLVTTTIMQPFISPFPRIFNTADTVAGVGIVLAIAGAIGMVISVLISIWF